MITFHRLIIDKNKHFFSSHACAENNIWTCVFIKYLWVFYCVCALGSLSVCCFQTQELNLWRSRFNISDTLININIICDCCGSFRGKRWPCELSVDLWALCEITSVTIEDFWSRIDFIVQLSREIVFGLSP